MEIIIIKTLLLLFGITFFPNPVDGQSSNSTSVSPAPSLGPLTPPPTTFRPISEPPIKVQLIFFNSYESVRIYLSDESFIKSIRAQLQILFGVNETRISDVEIIPSAQGRTVIIFKLTSGGNEYASNAVALNFFSKTDKQSIKITTNNNIVLTPFDQSCNWTESGCAMDTQCRPVGGCSQGQYQNNNLFALLVIPIVVIIVVIIVLLWFCKYKKPSEKSRIDLTELGYVENVSKFGGATARSKRGTISGLSLADNGTRNKVYSAMGDQYAFSFENADFNNDADEKEDVYKIT